MKLLNITTIRILILIFSAVSIWSAFFYFSLQKELIENIDEHLNSRKHEIIEEVKKKPSEFSIHKESHKDFSIEEIDKQEFDNIKENYQNIKIFEKFEKEHEPYRQLETAFTTSNKYLKLIIRASIIDKEELMNTIFYNVLLLYVILLSLIVFLNRYILQKLWKPFYSSLEKIQNYRLDKDTHIDFESSKIVEFKSLSNTLTRLINNNHLVYQQQKQFIENASHEIQTPLAIASGKLELFMQLPGLSAEHAEIIQSVNQNLERLSSLNKSLLLLSKIDNKQFQERTVIPLNELIKDIKEEFEQFAEYKKISMELIIESTVNIVANKNLIDILFRNLIKNAIYHNLPEGFIHIRVWDNQVMIENSGKEYNTATEILFNRFIKDSNRSESMGLGLSIVKAIVDHYNYTISYTVTNCIHKITLSF